MSLNCQQDEQIVQASWRKIAHRGDIMHVNPALETFLWKAFEWAHCNHFKWALHKRPVWCFCILSFMLMGRTLKWMFIQADNMEIAPSSFWKFNIYSFFFSALILNHSFDNCNFRVAKMFKMNISFIKPSSPMTMNATVPLDSVTRGCTTLLRIQTRSCHLFV